MKGLSVEKKAPVLSDFPDIELYMDQVLSVLEKMLSPFFPEEKCITSTMINNYVKQKLIPPPESKRYGKNQLTRLFMICILKSVLQLSEIARLLASLEAKRNPEEVYLLFCQQFDRALSAVFSEEKMPEQSTDATEFALSCALMAFAHILLTRLALGKAQKTWPKPETEDEKKEKEKKEKKEKKEQDKKEKKEKKEKK